MKIVFSVIFLLLFVGFGYLSADAYTVPEWVKNNAGWWAEDKIDDKTFINGIEFMVKENLIRVPKIQSSNIQPSEDIPDWIKNNADWWNKGFISDLDFLKAIEYFIEHGIIIIHDQSETNQYIQDYKEFSGEPNNPVKGTYSYFVQKVPHAWESKFDNVVEQSLYFWKYNYPGIKFIEARAVYDADFEIQMKMDHNDGTCGYFDNDSGTMPRIAVNIAYKENEERVFLTEHETFKILTHELGHVIGASHSNDPNNILYTMGCEYVAENIKNTEDCVYCQIIGINISPLKSFYFSDEVITISGTVPAHIGSKSVSIKVLDPNEHDFIEDSSSPSKEGKVNYNFEVSDAKIFGKYTVIVKYGGLENISHFELLEKVK